MSQNLPSNLQRLVLQPQQCDHPLINLSPEQQHYLQRVLRLSVGGQFIALDGKGHWWLAQLQADLSQALLIHEMTANQELPIPITVAIAMPKGNNIEGIIKQTTELGVSQIIPLWSDRTVIKTGTPVGQQKLERWQRIAQESAEQSLRAFVPEITSPQAFNDCLNSNYQLKFICVTSGKATHLLTYCLSEIANLKIHKSGSEIPQAVLIATGPEGGWTQAEEALALAQGFQPVSLGDRILAATTAPVVALAIVSAVLQTHDCS